MNTKPPATSDFLHHLRPIQNKLLSIKAAVDILVFPSLPLTPSVGKESFVAGRSMVNGTTDMARTTTMRTPPVQTDLAEPGTIIYGVRATAASNSTLNPNPPRPITPAGDGPSPSTAGIEWAADTIITAMIRPANPLPAVIYSNGS